MIRLPPRPKKNITAHSERRVRRTGLCKARNSVIRPPHPPTEEYDRAFGAARPPLERTLATVAAGVHLLVFILAAVGKLTVFHLLFLSLLSASLPVFFSILSAETARTLAALCPNLRLQFWCIFRIKKQTAQCSLFFVTVEFSEKVCDTGENKPAYARP